MNEPASAETDQDLTRTPAQPGDAQARSLALSQTGSAPIPVAAGYQILERIGEGAYGAVWLAREQKTGRHVAVKFYTHRGGLDWSLLSREVEKLALLYTSRNIVRLIDVGWQSDPPYYVMEYLEQGSLEKQLASGPLEPVEAVRIIRSVCQALVHAHGRGVLHCDLKPANILLDDGYEPRLCDFGQSRLSHEQNPALGTLFYMAPEQADLRAVPDARWDVYALGALLYQLLTGSPPYRYASNELRLQAAMTLEDRLSEYREIVRSSPRPVAHARQPGIDRRLVDIVDRCLQIDPDRRYANAQAVLDVLYIRDRQIRVKPLVALGGLLPGLLLLAMFFFAANAMNSAVQTAEENLTVRAIESDGVASSILASSLQREIENRLDALRELSVEPALVREIQAAADSGWQNPLSIRNQLDKARVRIAPQQSLDISWFLCDARGFQRWRSPFEKNTIDRDWSHRDYFHGLGSDFDPNAVKPIRKPHVSEAFQSRATDQMMVALSVPVLNETGQVIGVLARTTHLGQLLATYAPSIHGQRGVKRTMSLIDERHWQLIENSQLDAEFLPDQPEEQFARLKLSSEIQHRFGDRTGRPDVTFDDYADPISAIDSRFEGDWLAAATAVEGTRWWAIVQERKSMVLRPVYEMKSTVIRYAWFALAVSGVVVAVLWYSVLKSINEQGIRRWSRTAARGPEQTTQDSSRT
ncbi:MAG: protein kinase [Planctomycetaceae bacterium]